MKSTDNTSFAWIVLLMKLMLWVLISIMWIPPFIWGHVNFNCVRITGLYTMLTVCKSVEASFLLIPLNLYYHSYPICYDMATPDHAFLAANTVFTLSIATPQLLTILLKFENCLFHYPLMCFKYCWMNGKHCRPWSDATFCSICSVFTLCPGMSVPILRVINVKHFFFNQNVLIFLFCNETCCRYSLEVPLYVFMEKQHPKNLSGYYAYLAQSY